MRTDKFNEYMRVLDLWSKAYDKLMENGMQSPVLIAEERRLWNETENAREEWKKEAMNNAHLRNA